MPIPINKKTFPIKLDPKQAASIIQNALKKKGYKYEIKKDDLYLTITPYWFSFFDILMNSNGKITRISGQIALNAINNQINEKVIDIFKIAKPSYKEEIDSPRTEKIQINLKNAIINQKEAEKSIIKYLIYKYNVSQDQISISGIEEIYVPNWKVQLDKYKLKIDAITGEVNNFDTIKNRSKTKIELIKEVFQDIKEEKKIKDYITNIFHEIYQGILFIFKGIIKNYKIIIWIIIVALLLYLILTL